MIFRLTILFLAVSCASNDPTPYQRQKKKEMGYSDKQLENLRIATFRGNAYTSRERAQRYAEFRAIEVCRGTQEEHANILDIFDKTVEKQITRSSGTSWGPSYFGMYPYYSRYSSFGIGAGFNTISSDSWSETIAFPVMEAYFTCENKVYRPDLIFKELPADRIKHLVQDVKGAIQVEKIPEKSPNEKSVELGDIILKANGKRVEKVYQLIHSFGPRDQEVTLQLLREGERKKVTLRSKEVTKEVNEAEKKIISKVCKEKDKEEQKQLKKSKLCN